MEACPGCKATAVRQITVGRRQRIECVGCYRFVGYVSNEVPPARPASADPVPVAGLGHQPIEQPSAWLYVSKRLDLESLPNVPMWAAPVITFNDTAYYRLTAAVLAWLEAAGDGLATQVAAGRAERGQLDAYLTAMDVVWEFAYQFIPSNEIIRARSQPPSLPSFTQPVV